MDGTYRFDDDTYDALNKAGVPWTAIIDALQAHPRIRRHHDATLTITAPTPAGRWLIVACIEDPTGGDDDWLITGARWLTDTQTATARALTKGGPSDGQHQGRS